MALADYIDVLQQNVQNPWLQSAIIFGAFIILALVVSFIIDKIVVGLAKKTKTKADDIIISRTKGPLFYLILFLGLRWALVPLQITSIIENLVESFGVLTFVYILAVVIGIVIDTWGVKLAKKTKSTMDDSLLALLRKTMGISFVIFAFLWVFKIWDINITPYLAGLGIGGLVLGLALQDSLKNIFGGISLILDRSFNINDKIKLETGELGEILDIGLRSTKLKTYDNEIISIPNGQLANMRIQNFVRPNPKLRVVVDFGVEYGTKVEKVKKVVVGVLKKIKDASSDPYMDVVFTELADFSLHFQARFWVDDYKLAIRKQREAREKIYAALNKAKIGIPFPTRTVYLKKSK